MQKYKSDKITSMRSDFDLGDVTLINFVNLTKEDSEKVRNWRNHENVKRWMYHNHIITPEEHNSFIENLKNDNKNFSWLVKKKEEYIGVINLKRVDLVNRNAYLGIYSNPDQKLSGNGYILIESLKVLSFNIMDLHTLKLEVIDGNERAVAFYKKSGFNEEGRLREFIFKDSKWHNITVMGIIKTDKA